MAEYIERDKAIEAVRSDPMGGLNYKRILTDIPAADVVPVMHGKWEDKEVIHKKCIEEWQSARCSACGKYHTTPYMYYFDDFKFCPNCGADMRGEQDVEPRSNCTAEKS